MAAFSAAKLVDVIYEMTQKRWRWKFLCLLSVCGACH